MAGDRIAAGLASPSVTLRWAFAVIALACGGVAFTPAESLAQKRQRDRITREEILSSPHKDQDLYQVIRSLRPHFLEPPPGVRTLGGAYGPSTAAVYVEGVREMGLGALRTIAAMHVDEVRYLDPTRSENEFGPRASGGALTVKLYKAPKAPVLPRDSAPAPPPR